MDNQNGTIMENSLINTTDVKKYWNLLFKNEVLDTDETARIVFQAKVKPEFIEYDNLKNFEITDNVQLRSADDIINYMTNKQTSLPHHDCGISISSAIFNYDPQNLNEKGRVKAPSINTFKKTNSLVLDIDAHIKNSKERFHVYTIDPEYIKVVLMRSFLEVNKYLKTAGFSTITPTFGICSGGGIQLGFDFNSDIYQSDAKLIFTRLGEVLKKDRFGCVIKDIMGNYTEIQLEIDPTFKDISHTQRLAGLVNQKYSYIAQFFTNPDNKDIFEFNNQDVLKDKLRENVLKIDEEILASGYTDIEKKQFENYYLTLFKQFQKVSEGDIEKEQLPVSSLDTPVFLEDARIASAQRKSNLNMSDYNPMEFEIIQTLKDKYNQGALDLKLLFPDINFEDHGSYLKILCPFHEERTASMAVYKNSLAFKDFHDDKLYSIIAMYEKIFNVSKGQAVAEIADKANIKFKKSDRKEFEKMEVQELIDVLIDKVNVDDFVYYRLANKNRACIIRHIDSGETFSFDGMTLLANHILSNQLNIKEVDRDFISEFTFAFERKILIEAFEEFQPGKPVIFQRQFIKFVNLWVPSKQYTAAHKKAEELKEVFPENLSIEDSILIMKERTPWTFKYILQMVQKGDLTWFINWLTATAKHQVLPAVPIFHGIPGAGKNLFVSTVLEWYINPEFTKILSGDRLQSNFNSILETASLCVIDEGDFSSSKHVDNLKLITGSDKMLIEKKGIDTQSKRRHFNMLMFSNGDLPARHPSSDRRITYFNSEITLLELVGSLDITIEEFIDNIQEELEMFWGIILNTTLNKPMAMSNVKNGSFWKQILKMHPSGTLILQMMDNQWKDIGLQLNENIADPMIMRANLELLEEIKEQFQRNGKLSLTLINRYIQSLSFKFSTSIQRFIQQNNLELFGINIEIENQEVVLVINKSKLKKSLRIDNIVLENVPELSKKIKKVQRTISKMDPSEILSTGDKVLADKEAKILDDQENTQSIPTQTPLNTPLPPEDLDKPILQHKLEVPKLESAITPNSTTVPEPPKLRPME